MSIFLIQVRLKILVVIKIWVGVGSPPHFEGIVLLSNFQRGLNKSNDFQISDLWM